MRAFTYERAADARSAVAAVSRPGAKFISGGTNLLDLMKLEIEQPSHLVDISRLPFKKIEELPDGGLRIGAQAANSDTAADSRVRSRYPYFYDTAAGCNKRQPGSGCSAVGGFNRIHAILGASDACIAVHPSDMAVAMTALEAEVEVQAPHSHRRIKIADFHRLPGNTPQNDTNLGAEELITAVILPPPPAGGQVYRKVRDRASYDFALVSVAALVDL